MTEGEKKVTLAVIRERIESNLKADCPVAAMLRPKGAEALVRCKYIGFSKTCFDCTYNWAGIAAGLIGVVEEMLSEKQHEKAHSSKSMSKRALTEAAVNEGAQAASNLDNVARKMREIGELLFDAAEEARLCAGRTHERFQPFRDSLRVISPGYEEGVIGKPTEPLLIETSGEALDEPKKKR